MNITINNRITPMKNLKKIRIDKKLSQEDLAFMAKTTSKCISDIELGKRNVKIDTLSRIANALGINLSELVKSNN